MIWLAKVLYALHAPLLRPSKSIRMILRKGNRGARCSLPPSLPPPSPHILDADEETRTEGHTSLFARDFNALGRWTNGAEDGERAARARLNLASITRVIDLSPDSPLVCRVPGAATDF